jgi:hypothetical protein
LQIGHDRAHKTDIINVFSCAYPQQVPPFQVKSMSLLKRLVPFG